jgi:hypothetical protein
MSIKYVKLTVIYNNSGVFSTISKWLGYDGVFTKESDMVFLFDDGEIYGVNDICKDNALYKFQYDDGIKNYYYCPLFFGKNDKFYYYQNIASKYDNDVAKLDPRYLFNEVDMSKFIPSIYNCIYYHRHLLTKTDVFGIFRNKSNEKMPQFDIAFDSNKFTKDEVMYITYKIFLGKE